MVHIQSKIQTKNDFKILKSLGKIIAIAKHPVSITVVYEDGSFRVLNDFGITRVPNRYIPAILDSDPLLKFQVDLFNNILVMSAVEEFCYQTEEIYSYQANDMTFHKKFKIYFPFSEEWEVEIEII